MKYKVGDHVEFLDGYGNSEGVVIKIRYVDKYEQIYKYKFIKHPNKDVLRYKEMPYDSLDIDRDSRLVPVINYNDYWAKLNS